MALARLSSEFVYRSGVPSTGYYYFTVTVDGTGTSVRNLQTPTGLLTDSKTALPESVTDDIQTAIAEVEALVAASSSINGTLAFVAETSKTFVFATALGSTSYRVVFSMGDFVPVRVTNKLTTGFTIETGVTYTGDIGFDVFI